jgi:HSP20 family protein
MKNPLAKKGSHLPSLFGDADPFRELQDLQDRMLSLFNRSLGGGWLQPLTGSDWSPAVDITEEESCFKITADLPDVKKEEVNVSVENGVLTLSGERKQDSEEKSKRFHRTERSWGRYQRSFSLPQGANPEQISAQFKNGVLTITIQKTGEAKEQRRSVEISE